MFEDLYFLDCLMLLLDVCLKQMSTGCWSEDSTTFPDLPLKVSFKSGSKDSGLLQLHRNMHFCDLVCSGRVCWIL